jgi:small subunit ribosomal protein S9
MAETLTQTTGRRKTAVARVRFYGGSGNVSINGKGLDDYFPLTDHRARIMEPLKVTETEGAYDIQVKVEGGGTTGQVDAIRLGIARSLLVMDPELRPVLKKGGFLTRDDRRVEPKRYGLRKARRAPQFTKR